MAPISVVVAAISLAVACCCLAVAAISTADARPGCPIAASRRRARTTARPCCASALPSTSRSDRGLTTTARSPAAMRSATPAISFEAATIWSNAWPSTPISSLRDFDARRYRQVADGDLVGGAHDSPERDRQIADREKADDGYHQQAERGPRERLQHFGTKCGDTVDQQRHATRR